MNHYRSKSAFIATNGIEILRLAGLLSTDLLHRQPHPLVRRTTWRSYYCHQIIFASHSHSRGFGRISRNNIESKQQDDDDDDDDDDDEVVAEEKENHATPYFVVVPEVNRLLPNPKLLQSITIPPPPSAITFRQPQSKDQLPSLITLKITTPNTTSTGSTETNTSDSSTNSIPSRRKPSETITITEAGDIPVILFQSNRLLMVDKPAGWTVPISIPTKTLEDIIKPSVTKMPKRYQRLMGPMRQIPYMDTNIPWKDHPDNPDNTSSVREKNELRKVMKEKADDPIFLMNNMIQNMEHTVATMTTTNSIETEELRLIQQHLLQKQNRAKQLRFQDKIQRTQYTMELAEAIVQEKTTSPIATLTTTALEEVAPYTTPTERVRTILNTTAIDNNRNRNKITILGRSEEYTTAISPTSTTSGSSSSSSTAPHHPPSPNLVSYFSNIKYTVYRQDRIKYTSILPAHGIDPTTSGLVLLGTGPKSTKRFRTIYKQGYKICYAILQPIPQYRLQTDVLLRTRVEYNDEYPFAWKILDGYMLEQAPCTDELFPYDRVPTQIFCNRHEIAKLESNPRTSNLWYCSLEYRVVPHPQYENMMDQQPYICLEIKSKQVGHEVIRALLSTYQLPIFGDMRYGAKNPNRFLNNNIASNNDNDYDDNDRELEPIFPMRDMSDNNNTSYYRTNPYDTNKNKNVDLGLHGRIPLHCCSLQLPKHIHLGPQESLNVLQRTVISAPIPAQWEYYFGWTWDDIQAWEQSCIDHGIEAA